MESFKIMFEDLDEIAQRAFLEFQGLDNAEDGNFDCMPIAIVNRDTDID